jgi:hypothetical protein
MRSTPGYSLLSQRRNEDTLGKLKVNPVEKKLALYEQKCLNHINRLEDIRYQKQILHIDLMEDEDLDKH